MDIISLIIIIAIIKKVLEKDNEKNKKEQKQQSGEQWWQKVFDFVDKAGEYASQKAGNLSSSRSDTRSTTNNAYYYEQQKKVTKDRLRQKYGSQTTNAYAKNAVKTDILTRAKENVREEEQNTFKQEVHAKVCSEYRSHAESAPDLVAHAGHSPECDIEGESDIMKRVNDLIVMGYDGDLKFDRDFIAEGVEMLNSFSL